MQFLTKARKTLAALVFAISPCLGIAQTISWEVWDEKWPTDISITPQNAVVVYLRANFGWLGEIAADKLKNLLSDPHAQAKLAASGIEFIKNLYNNPNLSDAEKSKQLLAAIDADIASFISEPIGPMNVRVGFSGSFDVVRLTWDRIVQRLECRRQVCRCSSGLQVFSFNSVCNTGGLLIEYPVCTQLTDYVDLESQYKVFRNGKHIVTYGESKAIVPARSFSGSFTFGFLNQSLSLTLAPSGITAPGSAGPFYDYNAFSQVVGQPLSYQVTAATLGCGAAYDNNYVGMNFADSGSISVDSNGDGRPDFYPAAVLLEKRSTGAFLGTKVSEHTDVSGKMTVAVFERIALVPAAHTSDFSVSVPSDYVVIGGGAEGAELPSGNLLTASYPNDGLTAWYASAKDHMLSSPTKLKVWAVGLKVAGLTRQQLAANIIVNSSNSAVVGHPTGAAEVPPDYALLGGGFKVNWSGAGNLGLSSYPETLQTWRVSSKDHGIVSLANIQAFAIGIRRYIPGLGNILTNLGMTTSGYAAHPTAKAAVGTGYALAGCGALVNWTGAGNLLWKIRPDGLTTARSCEASSKDHVYSSPATINSYALGILAQ